MPTLESTLLTDFERDGYVVVRDLFDFHADLQPVIDEYEGLLSHLAAGWVADGRLASTYEDLPFGPRLLKIVQEAHVSYDLHFDISLPQADISDGTPMHHGPAVFDLLRNPKLLDVVEQFVGGEIYSNPVQHTRVKLPEHLLPDETRTGLTGQIDWHQDLGVITNDADDTEMLTVWFPLTPATKENGCLAVVPGSHRRELALHCRSRNPLTFRQVCIPAHLMEGEEQRPVPMQPGDVLFMHRRTRHCGLPNRSDEIRWSFDLRYHPIGQPTGREWFPGFVARSRSNPDSELRSAEEWSQLWRAARHRLAHGEDVAFNRWRDSDPRCA